MANASGAVVQISQITVLDPWVRSHDSHRRHTISHPPATSLSSYSAKHHQETAECTCHRVSFVEIPPGPTYKNFRRWKLVHRNNGPKNGVGNALINSGRPQQSGTYRQSVLKLTGDLPIDIVLIANIPKEPDLALWSEHSHTQCMYWGVPKPLVVETSTSI